MTDQLDMSALLREIDGVPVFAWHALPALEPTGPAQGDGEVEGG